MLTRLADTIVALTTPARRAPRAVVRMSGPDSLACAARCCRFDACDILRIKSSRAVAGQFVLRELGRPIPCQVLVWPGAQSYTRQPSVEFHVPGSPAIANAVVAELCQAGSRLAAPGEFTFRAFLAGRLDLTQVEAVLGVIDAASQSQLATALRQMAGGLAQPLHLLRDELLDLLSELEAALDFADEDIAFISRTDAAQRVASVQSRVESLARQLSGRGDASAVPSVALRGPPNVGKSSLMNALVGAAASIVANQPGTTRDFVSRTVVLAGVECRLVDTAGLEQSLPGGDGIGGDGGAESAATIDAQSQQMARDQQQQADLILDCVEAPQVASTLFDDPEAMLDSRTLRVWTKIDLARTVPTWGFPTSAHSGSGVPELQRAIAGRLAGADRLAEDAELPVMAATAARCGDALRRMTEGLTRCQQLIEDQGGDELIAAELRAVLDDLGQLTGSVVTDDILDRIFSKFCIGK
ncbi:MAG: tRNA uridine-5-carboxymethylaminomethyl(34) synthesis GTPase MnmE [Planctomycetes bacterium]|nr:tRNA uridine-5-carboxymethylaminomethyl(34) synthesis GTPase MnmE [Planctomycetota bacterium]